MIRNPNTKQKIGIKQHTAYTLIISKNIKLTLKLTQTAKHNLLKLFELRITHNVERIPNSEKRKGFEANKQNYILRKKVNIQLINKQINKQVIDPKIFFQF